MILRGSLSAFIALMGAALAGEAAIAQVSERDWFPGTSSLSEPEIVPPAYRGVWAPDANSCAEEHGVERLAVYAEGVESYESSGRVVRVTQAGQERSIRLRLSYEGEGQFWDRVETWTLNAPGDRLSISDPDGRQFTLLRCPR